MLHQKSDVALEDEGKLLTKNKADPIQVLSIKLSAEARPVKRIFNSRDRQNRACETTEFNPLIRNLDSKLYGSYLRIFAFISRTIRV
jgi:hypothetical protein